MSENQRKHPRLEVHINVQLAYSDRSPITVKTRDISEGGMFLEIENPSDYPLGEMVHLKYNDPIQGDMDKTMDAIIVRVADDGLGIAFVELDAF